MRNLFLGLFLAFATLESNALNTDGTLLVGTVVKYDNDYLILKSENQSFKIPIKYILFPKINAGDEIKVATTDALVKDWAITKAKPK